MVPEIPDDLADKLGPLSKKWLAQVKTLPHLSFDQHCLVAIRHCKCHNCFCCFCLLIKRKQFDKVVEHFAKV